MAEWEVVVIGAGAAGMLAAARAAMRGRRTLLLEKNRKLGVKILISGGTRCNITHHADARGIAEAFPKRQGQFLRSPLAALPPERLLAMIEQEGVATKIEATGKIFPVSDRAIDVRDALARILQRSGCEVRPATPVRGIERLDAGFRVELPTDALLARRLIVACGGQSYPGCGTTGDAYAWARHLGHSLVPPVPALTPILSPDPWLTDLSGVTLSDAALTVVDRTCMPDAMTVPKAAVRDARRGSLLFTHKGLSGPAALDLSRAITLSPTVGDLLLLANFVPPQTLESCARRLRELSGGDGKRQLASVLGEQLPRRLVTALLGRSQIDPDRRMAELSKREASRVAMLLTQCPINIAGTAGFAKAEVTAGGVVLEEINSKTMESKLVRGCYFAGEVLDLDGPIGGYNFQAAFSTGWLAGSSI